MVLNKSISELKKIEIENRCIKLADFIIKTNGTIRSASDEFKIPHTTVHRDVSKVLKEVDYNRYIQVQKVIEKNKVLRHIRSGEITRLIYLKRKAI